MTLLDRFRTQPGQHHPDPAVRLAYVDEIPLDARDVIAAIAQEDEDPRVRRAAVAKLLDPGVLGKVARDDGDTGVREQAAAMLRDIALETFEGLQEGDSLEAVEALEDQKTLGQIAKATTREIVALRALSRISDPRMLGSVARHASLEAARQRAFGDLRERSDQAELVAVAMNGEHKDTAVAAVELVTDRATLELIELRSRNKSAVKRARTLIREADESAELAARELHDREIGEKEAEAQAAAAAIERSSVVVPEGTLDSAQPTEAVHPVAETATDTVPESSGEHRAPEQERVVRRHARLGELCDAAVAAADEPDLATARKQLGVVRREWRHLAGSATVSADLQARFDDALARVAAREAEAKDAEARARREALARLHHLIGRVETLAAKSDLTLKAGERALRDLRAAIEAVPPMPSRDDYEDVTQRLKAAQSLLMPKVLELREAADWQRFANAAIQERLCVQMEALRDVEDPDSIAREVRDLQQQWRQAADVPRAQADVLWRRFKSAHDAVWTRAEALFTAQAEVRATNLEQKTALCERAEALADSTQWIQTAEELKRLQAEWKSIGPVTRGSEKAIWDRFRSACDRFFKRRHDDLASRKKMWAENLAKKEGLCQRAEALAESTDWDRAAAELKRLQGEWRAIGPVKKSRSEAIWQRFRAACDRFFERYAARHDAARAERVAAREALCVELETMSPEDQTEAPADIVARVRAVRARWQQEVAARGVDPERARALERRFSSAVTALVGRWPAAFLGSDLDPQHNHKRMESLVKRVEGLAASLPGPLTAAADGSLATNRLAAMLKEALAANTIGGRADDESRLRAAVEEMRQAQASWARIGPTTGSDDARRALSDRFQKACQLIAARASSQMAPPTKPSKDSYARSNRPRRIGAPDRTDGPSR